MPVHKKRIDFLRKETPTDEDDMINFSFKILRVINKDDLQLENWNPKKNIKVLPILKDKHITNEEEHWAGKVKGNEVEQVLSSIIIIFLSYVIYNNANTGLIYFSPLILLWGYQIYDHGWIRTKKPDLNKLQQLTYYKETLLQEDVDLHKENFSQLDKNLMEFDFWKNIKPNEFELALARKLNNDGMRVKTTEFIGDGGIDIEGVDENGTPIIVQAKQFAGNIGVSVVREMIGVREEHPKNPRVVIYSLMGFSTGAKELAKTHNIELMSVRDDLLK